MRIACVVILACAASIACDEPVAVEARASTRSTPAPEASPAAPPSAPAAASDRVGGVVLETMDAGGYTYLRLKTESGDVWAAIRQSKIEKGKPATVVGSVWLEDFESKTLSRRFDRILFGALPGDSAGQPASAMRPHPASAPPEVGTIAVTRAAGPLGRTVAEVFAQRTDLKDRPVEVRGQVVKFLPGIMGRNWLHLRDGSGTREKANDDLTVTTTESAAVGDVVLVSGSLGVDRDFGSGYKYDAIVENATLSR